MTTTSVAFAIIGYGAIAESHAIALEDAGIRLRAVVGPNAEKAAAFAGRHDIPQIFADLTPVLESKEIEAVVIASPSAVHAAQGVAALASGKHVLIEIPVGLSLADAESVARTARESGRVAMVCHTQRFWPPMVALLDLLEQRHLTVRHVVARTTMRRHENIGWTGYRRSWVDNLLWHHGCHAVDSTLQLVGDEPRAIHAEFGPAFARTGLPMDIGILLASSSNALGTIALSYNSMIGTSDYLVITDEESFFLDQGNLFAQDGSLLAGGEANEMQRRAVRDQDGEFLSAIRTGRAGHAGVESVLPAMRVLETVQQASPAG